MFQVCTEAVDCVALWTRTSSQVWTCFKYVYRSSLLRSTLNTNVITGSDMFQVCTEAVDCVALWTRTSSQVWTCFKYDPKIRKTKHFFSQVWTCVTFVTKTKTLLPVGRMLSLGPWPRVLPKPNETMFNMHKNKRLLWGVHDQKRARPRTRKEQPGSRPFFHCSPDWAAISGVRSVTEKPGVSLKESSLKVPPVGSKGKMCLLALKESNLVASVSWKHLHKYHIWYVYYTCIYKKQYIIHIYVHTQTNIFLLISDRHEKKKHRRI